MLLNTKSITLKHHTFINHLLQLAAFSTLMFSSLNASAVTFQPNETGAKDVWIQSSLAGAGDDEQLHVWKSNTVGGFKSLYEILNLTTSMPWVTSSADITSATLSLYVIDTEGGSHGSHGPGFDGLTLPIEVSAMANPWAEDNWAGGSPEANALWSAADAASGGPVTTYNVSGSDVNNRINLDVTDLVRSWIDYELTGGVDGLPYYGFLIEAPLEIRASDNAVLTAAFYSSGADASFRPSLEISTIPLPSAVWLMGSGLLGLIGIARSSLTSTRNKHA